MAVPSSPEQVTPPAHLPQPNFRSSAVARMVGMPVATLRVWEQRYQAVKPMKAASGHRLYTATDVERVILLRRLTQQGHAIGLLASLDMAQMRSLLHSRPGLGTPSPETPLRVIVIGESMGYRLKCLTAPAAGARTPLVVGCYDSLAEAAQAARASDGTGVDLLLWQAGGLQRGMASELHAAQQAWRARAMAVAYRYSNAAAHAELLNAGAIVALEPLDDVALGLWLASVDPFTKHASLGYEEDLTGVDRPARFHRTALPDQPVSPPRFADGALAEFARLQSAIACECPRHLAQLIQQISYFENYSNDCFDRNPADARLHAHLRRVAGAARMLFESALVDVARAEGLPLPSRVDQ